MSHEHCLESYVSPVGWLLVLTGVGFCFLARFSCRMHCFVNLCGHCHMGVAYVNEDCLGPFFDCCLLAAQYEKPFAHGFVMVSAVLHISAICLQAIIHCTRLKANSCAWDMLYELEMFQEAQKYVVFAADS